MGYKRAYYNDMPWWRQITRHYFRKTLCYRYHDDDVPEEWKKCVDSYIIYDVRDEDSDFLTRVYKHVDKDGNCLEELTPSEAKLLYVIELQFAIINNLYVPTRSESRLYGEYRHAVNMEKF